ncbi:MAG: SLC13 family permease, partial [Pseudomonadota bacterium]|nr:SLC13 family permease [Pseudomonadota bacterium]
ARSRTLADVMINPGSRLVDMSLEQIGFHRQFKTIILGIQRRARVVRRRLGRIRLEAGDVLLVCGSRTAIEDLRGNQDMIVLSGSKQDLAKVKKAPVAAAIFLFVIALAAAGMMTIPVAAITGAVAMIATGCLNVRQATRAVDRKIFLLVGSMLALGAALKTTNGAGYLAERLLELPFVDTPLALAVVLFIIVAITTNVLTNNACAILFTPIAMNLANEVGIDPMTLAITVIFAANCSFASPIGYQTNLLVMGPGHYRFGDFIKAGVPLILILWVTYIFVAHYYFGLNGLWFK